MIRGDKYTVKIEDTTLMGAGVAKIDGGVVFVDGCVEGDVCEIEITDVKKNFSSAMCRNMISESKDRCDSDCSHYPDCGGCVFRHVKFEYENSVKENAVRSALKKSGLEVEKFNGILYGSAERFRNKATFHFAKNGDGGFCEHDSRRVVAVDDCVSCPEIFSEIAAVMTELIRDGLRAPDEMALRVSADREVSVAITGKLSEAEKGKIAMCLCSRFPNIVGISVRATEKEKYKAVMGEKHVTGKLFDLRFRISPEAFFQVNYEGAEKLFGEVIRMAEKCSFTKCADLYCGTGTIGMLLASRFRDASFTGVEINREAVADAKYNAKLNGLKNIKFHCGDAAEYASSESPELVVVDPPRRGLSDGMIDVLCKLAAENVIYVSCNPFTLTRDLKKLCEFGYEINEVTPVNMFPRSEHCEVIVSMTR
ncbi:MAG: 23S rRNA (uracil(1939)-C(5))-methyltransferase RlmD [Clostridia bacterium]|nr:23S rRNA (uracil(1939)-C(5))-methyltransferase RlmD [Clostridia bacterium]